MVWASATEGRGGRKTTAARAGGNNWWSPLFGWSAEPDYIDGPSSEAVKEPSVEDVAEMRHRPTSRRFPMFTEEKARELRMRMKETDVFHDVMYHSAIASRLASDMPRRSSASDL